MRRFTVSLPDDIYTALRERGDAAVPPASLQQMVRHAVDTVLKGEDGPQPDEISQERSGTQDAGRKIEAVDLLVFSVRDVTYGIPIEVVETVAADMAIHHVPSSSESLLGVAAFRDQLTEVHDGGIVLQQDRLDEESRSLIAIPGPQGRLLITVSHVTGLTTAAALQWSNAPESSPPWVSALAWNEAQVIAVVDPAGFNL
jgi:chemotaxis signal transduction protein